jgi:hypothetical protein
LAVSAAFEQSMKVLDKASLAIFSTLVMLYTLIHSGDIWESYTNDIFVQKCILHSELAGQIWWTKRLNMRVKTANEKMKSSSEPRAAEFSAEQRTMMMVMGSSFSNFMFSAKEELFFLTPVAQGRLKPFQHF